MKNYNQNNFEPGKENRTRSPGPASNGMNRNFEQKFKSAPGSELSPGERARMREHLLRYMAENPLPAAGLSRASSWSSDMSWSFYLSRAGAFAALLIMAGGGISFAAENALPGNPLYAVKRSINEPVRAALAISTEAKASWNAEEAGRRLGEAEQMASNGTLSAETAQSLGADFEKSAQAAAQQIAVLKETRPNDANVASAKLSASLSAHESILRALDGATGASDVQEKAQRFRGDIAAVRGEEAVRVTAATKTNTAATLAVPAASSAQIAEEALTTSDTEVLAFKKAALEARTEAVDALAQSRSSLSAELQKKADSVLAEIDAMLASADDELAADARSSDALRQYKRALLRAQGLPVLLRAAASLKLPALLDDEEPPPATSTDSRERKDGTRNTGSSDVVPAFNR